MNQGNPPPNWYPDPRGEAELRYWDGNQWTEHTHSSQQAGGGETVAAQVPQSAPPPSTAPPPQAAPPAATSAAGPQGAYGPGPSGPTGAGPSGGGLGKRLPLIIGGALAAIALVVVLVLVLGGGEEKSEEDRVNEAAEKVITTTEPSACRELATEEFVQKLTGETGSAAIDACEENNEAFGEGAKIDSTELDGDKATVELEVEGGDADGETIEMTLLKDEEDWKVDELVRTEQTEGPNAEAAVRSTVLNFGSSEGSTACEYLSYAGIQGEGGKAACQQKFKEATATTYTVQDITLSGLKATVVVTNPSDDTLEFKLSHEAGNWKIDSSREQ